MIGLDLPDKFFSGVSIVVKNSSLENTKNEFSMRYWFVIGAMVLCVLVLSGCGGSSEATITGEVTC
jgi:hypothetical protein